MSSSTWRRPISPGDGGPAIYLPGHGASDVTVAFTTRGGGVSPAPFDSLNLAFHTGDEPDRVLENRAILARALGYAPDDLTCGRQVHGVGVAVIDATLAGAGAADHEAALADTDALITDLPGVPLAVFTADCVPIVLVGERPSAVGVVHAGWRGTLDRIVTRTVAAMGEAFGSAPERLTAYIGPAIRGRCYTVGADTLALFVSAFGADVVGTGPALDLIRVNHAQLRKAGVAPGNIVDIGLCTHCRAEFFSHRREGTTGRQAAVTMINRH